MATLTFEKKDIEDNKVMAAISYIWILCLIPLLTKKDSKFVQIHAKQGLALFIIETVGILVYWIPLFGQLLWLLTAVVAIVGLVTALQGKYIEIPVVSILTKKLNI